MVGNAGAGLYARAISYCANHLTDGFVPAEMVKSWLTSGQTKLPDKLIETGLWEPIENGYMIRQYLDYNPTREDYESKRAKQSEGGRRGAEQRWRKPQVDGSSHRSTQTRTHDDLHAPVPVPVPSREGATRGWTDE